MRAVVCTKYGGPEVLQVKEVAKPVPKEDEVLVKIHATSVTVSDCWVRSGRVDWWLWLPMRFFVGFTRPRKSILGFELAGEVESVGKNVKRFKPGDRVFAFTGKNFGAYAEYACLPENGKSLPADCVIASMPSNVTFEEAAALPSRGTLAWYFLQKANLQKGQKVLVYGASGGAGTFAVQLAKQLGAEVTGVCSTANLGWVKSLGADKVADYTQKDFLKNGETYDVIFDAVGKKKTSAFKTRLRQGLAAQGRYLSIDDGTPHIYVEDFYALKARVEAGNLKPVLDRRYTLDQAAEAHRYVENGHKKGNVVLQVVRTGEGQTGIFS
jgi:NADPH:quinone reductase-like Zn-dependent oxidoreductase